MHHHPQNQERALNLSILIVSGNLLQKTLIHSQTCSHSTRAENESHKLCSNGARVLCPGHGDDPTDLVKCIFTHADGTLMPCRMREDSVPVCTCAMKCYCPR